jgi:hypothetical protein
MEMLTDVYDITKPIVTNQDLAQQLFDQEI